MTDKSRFERSCAILGERFPQVGAAVRRGDEAPMKPRGLTLSVIPASSGQPTLEAVSPGSRTLLHSGRDPVEEAIRFVREAVDGSEDLVVLFGFGLGYHTEEILRANRTCRLFVIEPSPLILMLALGARDLGPLLASERLFLSVDPDGWTTDEAASLHGDEASAKLIVARPYRALFPETAEKVERDFAVLRSTRAINLATLKRFDRLWTKNTLKNSVSFFTRDGIERLAGSMTGLPAVVVSSGPSLQSDLSTLAGLQGKAVIVAVDSALCPLIRRGIMPDFAVTVDPQLVNSLFTGEVERALGSGLGWDLGFASSRDLPVLVADPAVHPLTLRRYGGDLLITSSVFAPGKVVERFSGRKGQIAAGGSVSVAAFDLARILGADPIILLGLDLSYPLGRTHIAGSLAETLVLSACTRLEPAHTVFARVIRSGQPVVKTDRAGKPVVTDRRMLLYEGWFERQGRDCGARVVNATRGGLAIPGIEDAPLERLAAEIGAGDAERKRECMTELRKGAPGASLNRRGIEDFIRFLEGTGKNLSLIDSLSRRAGEVAETCLRSGAGRADGMDELSRLDGEILAFREETSLLSMVMQGSITDIIEGRNTGDRESAYRNSLLLYSSIAEGSRFLTRLLGCAEKKLNKLLADDDNKSFI